MLTQPHTSGSAGAILAFFSSSPLSFLKCSSVLHISSRSSLAEANLSLHTSYTSAANKTIPTDTSGDHCPTWFIVSLVSPSLRIYHSIQQMKATTSSDEMITPARRVIRAKISMIRRKVVMAYCRCEGPLEVRRAEADGSTSGRLLDRRGRRSETRKDDQLRDVSPLSCSHTCFRWRHKW